MPEKAFLNIAAYRFFDLQDAAKIRLPLRQFCRELGLRGTILLSQEGVNLMLSGRPEDIEKLQRHLREELQFPALEYKMSWGKEIAFSRMLVKIKKELVPAGVKRPSNPMNLPVIIYRQKSLRNGSMKAAKSKFGIRAMSLKLNWVSFKMPLI